MKLWAKLSVWWCPACDFSREFQRVLGAKQWRNKNSIYGIYGLLLEPLTQLSRLLLAFLCEHRLLIHCTCRLCHLSALHENTQQLHALKAILNVERGLTMAAKQEALFCWLWCALDLPPFSRLNWNLWIHGKMFFANFANFHPMKAQMLNSRLSSPSQLKQTTTTPGIRRSRARQTLALAMACFGFGPEKTSGSAAPGAAKRCCWSSVERNYTAKLGPNAATASMLLQGALQGMTEFYLLDWREYCLNGFINWVLAAKWDCNPTAKHKSILHDKI